MQGQSVETQLNQHIDRRGLIGRAFDKALASPLGRRLATRALKTEANIPYFQNYLNANGYYPGVYGTTAVPRMMDRDYLRWALSDIGSSSIVQAGRRYLSLGLSAPRLMLVKEDLEGQQIEITRHPAIDRLMRPNDFCTWAQFIESFAFNWLTGTHYVRKERDRSQPGSPIVALWPEPRECVRPVVERATGGQLREFLSGYEIARDGRWYKVATEDVIPFCDGFDPQTREGRNWIRSIAAELFADKGISNHIAGVVANGLMKLMVLGVGDRKNAPTPEVLKLLQQFADERMRSSDSNLLLLSGNVSPVEIQHDLGADGLNKLRKPSEERFAAAMGISVVSLLFAAGAEVSTYSNVETLMRRDFRQVIVPTLKFIAEILTRFLLTEYATIEQANGKRLMFGFDYSQVPEMQRDKKVDQEWTNAMFTAGGLKHREWREQMGYPGGEDKYIWEIPGLKAVSAAAAPGDQPASDAPPQSAVPSENALDGASGRHGEGATVRRLLLADGRWHPVPRDVDVVRGQGTGDRVQDETGRVM